ncbi:MAG: SAVED domain-containing protein, partial [Thaumarchaeota archaeon]|nr:SAVED domain-containing protein [Nitrososphaerota archaeon]
AFELAVRGLFAEIEATAKRTKFLHVFPALPIAAAVMLGRVRDPQVHPRLIIYDRTADGYQPVLEVA